VLSSFVAERRTGETLFDISDALNGCLSGLVSITAGCALIEPWAAVVIGGIAGAIYLIFSSFLVRIKIDDAVDAIPVHFANGMWGVIAVGLFAVPEHLQAAYGRSDHVGWFYSFSRGSSDATLLGANLVGLLFIFGWVLGMMAPFFLFLNYLGWFRSDALEEVVGLDISYHGGPAYINDDIYAGQMTHVYEVAKAKDAEEFEEEENDKEGIA
jgi:Amt family ammonium transporter